MKVLLVLAHPEPSSLNGALHRIMRQELEAGQNQVKVSDLYTMRWRAEVRRDDFSDLPDDARLRVAQWSSRSYTSDTLTEDVKVEQEKLLWADTVILQFPLWWFTVPAILKGWIDRVYACGFAYGVGEHNDKRWGDRYGEGRFTGKRAMLLVTVGGWETHYSARGVNGPIADLLFPINHGVLYYPGFNVLPSFVVYRADRVDGEAFDRLEDELRWRMRNLGHIEPIHYRQQNGGDYEIPSMTLHDGLESEGDKGFALHIKTS